LKPIQEFITVSTNPQAFVLEKPPRPHEKTKGIFKDGIHIVFPFIVTNQEFQHYLRDITLKDIGQILEPCRFLNTIDDIYDKSIIKGNWLMYGSNKPNEQHKWTLTHIYTYTHGQLIQENIDDYYHTETLIETLSIRNKFDENPYQPGKHIPKPQQEIDIPDSASTTMTNFTFTSYQNVEHNYIKELVSMLKPTRADKYDSWMRVGWCLHNIEPSPFMLDLWNSFSKQSNKYTEGECDHLWQQMHMNINGLKQGSLCMWAKEDNPSAYTEASKRSVNYLIQKSLSGTHTEVARVIHRCYEETFVCASLKQNTWYEYKNHRWVNIENAFSLRQNISNQVVAMYMDQAKQLKDRERVCNNEDEQDKLKKQSIKVGKLAGKLMTTSFKEGLMKECAEMFYDPEFQSKLDTNPKLLGFNNGVYDLNTHEFRAGKTTDHITMSCGYRVPEEDDPNIIHDIMTFIASIMPNQQMQEYLLKVMAYMLDGDKYMEELWFFTGRGRNGKGTLCGLLKVTMGEYYYEPDITIVTTTKKSSSGVSPETVKAIGKRVLVASEPDDEDKESKFRVNRLKQLRGNDLIQARDLYKGCVEFKPQFGMIFQMNDKPELSKVDDAIGKSLRIIEFPFQFVSKPNQEYQRKIDTSLKQKFDDTKYRQQFMRILLKYHKEYVSGNQTVDVPQEVEGATKEYLEENNPVSKWLNDNFTFTGRCEDRIGCSDMFHRYSNSYPKPVPLIDRKFASYMVLLGFKSKVFNGKRYYIGLVERNYIDKELELSEL
jgi:P4 family phage/plasmid primase-like protien